ncbi:MAG: ankyrin repeat domain-containing protein [Candidatus Micrarchaeaceae archaeon]
MCTAPNVNLVGNVGFTPLIEAVSKRVSQVVCLREHGASCLELGPDMPMIRLLLDHSADPNFRVKGRWMAYWDHHFQYNYFVGSSALCIAARYGLAETAEILLKHSADPSITRSDGVLPVDIARENGHPKTAAVIERFMANHGKGKQASIPALIVHQHAS